MTDDVRRDIIEALEEQFEIVEKNLRAELAEVVPKLLEDNTRAEARIAELEGQLAEARAEIEELRLEIDSYEWRSER